MRFIRLLFHLSALCAVWTSVASAATWYVRPDGGTRYSSVMSSGQCNGLSDLSLAAAIKANGGTGTPNMACAFSDFRFLYQDGSYASNDGTQNFASPHWGWVISGGDTVIVRGSLDSGVSYRIGWNNPANAWDDTTGMRFGLSGDPYGSGIPTPPSGTASAPTRILGENYASCSAPGAKTQLHGGYGTGIVLALSGASYVEVECLDITDFSSCGLSSQTNSCNRDIGRLSDYAGTGVYWNNTSTHDTLKNVHVHGLARNGFQGPTGDGVQVLHTDLIGNASSGWNADNGDGTTGVGSLLVQNFNISWNGCAEEYPITDALPYQDCTDDNSGGYGDGFGTATVAATVPWKVQFDQGTVSYNTQDGLDALHLIGAGSSMTITRVLAYGNMGEQLKNGGENGTIENSVIVGNCYAMQNAIPGTPSGFNSRLSDYCRAANNGVLITTAKNATTIYRNNTLFSGNAVGILLQCDQTEGPCDTSSKVDFRNNIFVGYKGTNRDDYPEPIYLDQGDGVAQFPPNINPFSSAGSYNSHNITFHPKANWTCPSTAQNEVGGICSDPNLKDESEHLYGFNDATPNVGSIAVGAGVNVDGLTLDYSGLTRALPTTIGAIDPNGISGGSTTTEPVVPSPPVTTVPARPTPPAVPVAPAEPVKPTYTSLHFSTASTASLAAVQQELVQVTVRALTGSAIPSGTVQIYAGNLQILTLPLDATGSTSFTLPTALVRSLSLSARYRYNNGFWASNGAL